MNLARRLNLSYPVIYKRTVLRYRTMSTSSIGQTAWIAMDKKEELPNVTRLSEHVVRVLGQNPGKFTLQGTNTYLIGTSSPYILVDTGEGRPEYIPVLSEALESLQAESPISAHEPVPLISDIIISHWHHDHVAGIPGVLALLRDLWLKNHAGKAYPPPKLHKYPIKNGTDGEHHSTHYTLPKLIAELSNDLYTPPPSGTGFFDLHDMQTFVAGSEDGKKSLLRVLHTPGHTVDSISLYIPADKALYTADTVLGHGTAVFEDLATYLASLNKMLHFGTEDKSSGEGGDDIDLSYVSLYPAHGQVVSNGRETIATYIKHRLDREAQILETLHHPVPAELVESSGSASNSTPVYWTTWTLVKKMYASYPESLWLPAARGVWLHLKKLEGEGAIRRVGSEGKDIQWELLDNTQSRNVASL